jgi:hypothetical protein
MNSHIEMSRSRVDDALIKILELNQWNECQLTYYERIRESRIMTRASSIELDANKQKYLDKIAQLNVLEERLTTTRAILNLTYSDIFLYCYNERLRLDTSTRKVMSTIHKNARLDASNGEICVRV